MINTCSKSITAMELELQEKQWTKHDLYEFLSIPVDESLQRISGIIMFKKTPDTITFLNEWLSIMTSQYSLIDDSSSNTPNDPIFKENRHDDCVF